MVTAEDNLQQDEPRDNILQEEDVKHELVYLEEITSEVENQEPDHQNSMQDLEKRKEDPFLQNLRFNKESNMRTGQTACPKEKKKTRPVYKVSVLFLR